MARTARGDQAHVLARLRVAPRWTPPKRETPMRPDIIAIVSPRELRYMEYFLGSERFEEDEQEPYRASVEAFRSRGYRVEAGGDQDISSCARILFWNAYNMSDGVGLRGVCRQAARVALGRRRSPLPRDWVGEASRVKMRDRLVLIAFEPSVVAPDNYWPSMHRQVGRVLTWDDDLVDGERFFKFRTPVPAHRTPLDGPPFEQRKLLTHISYGSKTSRHRGELYSERRRAVAAAEQLLPDQFDLYGWAWDKLPVVPRSYRGAVANTSETMSRYRFAFCFENNCNQRGYVTEKIMECLLGGCVPIYLGAPNIAEYVDPKAFIDMRRFGGYEALIDYLLRVDAVAHEEMVGAGREYLESESFRQFTTPAFVEQMLRGLGLPASPT